MILRITKEVGIYRLRRSVFKQGWDKIDKVLITKG